MAVKMAVSGIEIRLHFDKQESVGFGPHFA